MSLDNSVFDLKKALSLIYDKLRFLISLIIFIFKFLLWPGKRVPILIDGGLGDIIPLTPYFLIFMKIRSIEFRIFTKTTKPNSENLSYDTTRVFKKNDELSVDPRLEWLQAFFPNVPLIHIFQRSSIKHLNLHHRWFITWLPGISAKAWRRKSNFLFNLAMQNNAEIYSDAYFELLDRVKELKNKKEKIVAIHLRRNTSAVLKAATYIQDNCPRTTFIILGSSEHQNIPNFSFLKKNISLIDSYQLDIATVPLLSLVKDVDLFIGGRGGFEVFSLINNVPSVILFDDIYELRAGHFDKLWWKENSISKWGNGDFFDESILDDAVKVLKN